VKTAVVAIAAVLAVTSTVAAAAPVTTQVDGAAVDWTRGLIEVRAGAAADLRAPSAAIARVKAERQARERASAALARAAAALPRAAGVATPDAAALAGEVIALAVRYGSDGSVIVEMGLPLEAVRRAVAGPSRAARSDGGPTALIVDARGTALRPAVGYRVAAGSERYAAPMVFFRDRDALAADPRVGARARRVSARSLEGGAIALEEMAAPLLAEARAAGAPVFVLIK
jgi:hypothetical protein